MKKTAVAQWVFNFVVLAIIALALVGLLWLFAKAIDTGATVLAGTLAGLATVSAAVIVRYFERKKEGEAARRQHLGPLYERMAATLAWHSVTDRESSSA